MKAACVVAVGILALISLPMTASAEDGRGFYGAFGPEGPRLREQWWILPSTDPTSPLRATVFRPDDEPSSDAAEIRRPMVVINHGTSDATRLAVGMPIYYWLSRWFVERGYVVVLPQRRGHGATGGAMVESIGSCANPDHYHSGLAAAADIEAAVRYMQGQPFVAPAQTIVVGISSGGWASLALASRNPENVRAVINIAGGRGGRPFGRTDHSVCGEKSLLSAARTYGLSARIPTLWLYSSNDTYFRPDLAQALATQWQSGGGKADLHIFPPYGTDGHNLADDRAGWDVWGDAVDQFLSEGQEAPVATLEPEAVSPVEAGATSSALTVASDGQTRAP